MQKSPDKKTKEARRDKRQLWDREEQLAKVQQQLQDKDQYIEHLNNILSAIHRINRLITRTDDSDRMLSRVCDILTENRGYYNAWILLLNSKQTFKSVYDSGFNGEFDVVREKLQHNQFTDCACKALQQPGPVVIDNPAKICKNCPLAPHYSNRSAISVRIADTERIYGLLTVSISRIILQNSDECDLLEDIAADLSLALQSIDARLERRRSNTIVNTLPQPMAFVSTDYRYLTVNEAYADFYNAPVQQIIGRRVEDFLRNSQFKTIKPNLDRCLKGETIHYDIQIDFGHKGRRWMSMQYHPYFDKNGRINGIISHGLDITDRKNMELNLKTGNQQLSASEQQLRATNQQLRAGEQQLAAANQQLAANNQQLRASEQQLRANERQLKAKSAEMQKLLEKSEKQRLANLIVLKDLTETSNRLKKEIKERHQAQKSLFESEKRFRRMYEHMEVGIAFVSLEFKIEAANQAYCKMLGYKENELVGKTLNDITHPDTLKANLEKQRQLRRGEIDFFRLEKCFIHKDGHTVYGILDANLVRNAEGNPHYFLGSVLDITDRKLKEQEILRQRDMITMNNRIANVFLKPSQESIYADILDIILDVMQSQYGFFGYINDQGDLVCPSMTRDIWAQCQVEDKSIIFPQDQWNGLWGRSLRKKQVLVSNTGLKLPEGHVPLNNALAVPILHQDELIGQFVVANKSGGYTQQHCELLESAAAQTAPILRARLEETRHKQETAKLEEQYRQAQKMESVGRLAGGVAHDFNNMLSVILGYSEMAMSDLDPQDELYAQLQEIDKAANRSAELTAQLLAFARKQTINPQILDLNETVSHMLNMLQRLIGEDIELIWKPGAELWAVKLDPAQINQILANLCVNARDAISNIGDITLETENINIDSVFHGPETDAQPGDYVMLAVMDSGCGMDADIAEQIFDPFFTTKEQGQGTGLGLSTVYGAVQQNNGFLKVCSEPGQGTTFKLFFPRHTGDIKTNSTTQIKKIPRGHHEQILLVEDETAILNMTQNMLKSLGYRVQTASSPAEALNWAQTQQPAIDLLITDVVMPEMNGRELAEQFRTLYPDLNVLFMSGYTEDAIEHRGVLEEHVFLMQKPFNKETLAVKVRKAMKS
ncbi:MAG: PAS domain S-box protein [candidate division KSB1 bacterium]|nr:PAS domain S-box protein [candidate division KSB1 bacterium]